VATSTRDSVRDDKGGEANGDVSSVSEAAWQEREHRPRKRLIPSVPSSSFASLGAAYEIGPPTNLSA